MRIEQLTCAIGAELLGMNLRDALRDDSLFKEIRGGAGNSDSGISGATGL